MLKRSKIEFKSPSVFSGNWIMDCAVIDKPTKFQGYFHACDFVFCKNTLVFVDRGLNIVCPLFPGNTLTVDEVRYLVFSRSVNVFKVYKYSVLSRFAYWLLNLLRY